MQTITHRDQTGPTYKNVAIHAPPGLHELVHALAERFLDKSSPVMEIGAGSGALSVRLHDHGFSVFPVDLDGNDWHIDIPLTLADLNRPDWFGSTFPGKAFRQIIAVEVIEHLENPSKFFRDIAAILPAGGRLILTTPNVFNMHSVHAAFTRGELSLFSPHDCIGSGHISILPWWLLQHLSGRAGLQMLHCQGVCDIPLSGPKQWMLSLLRRIRRCRFRPSDFQNPEGLNVVMVFEKR